MYPLLSFYLSRVIFASVHTFPSRPGAMGNTSNNDSSLQERAITQWLLFRGNRLLIDGIALGLIWVISFMSIEFRVLEVGSSSTMPTLLGGIIAGQLTLFTVTLSINQLILSRMFVSPSLKLKSGCWEPPSTATKYGQLWIVRHCQPIHRDS
jgi:hypothetical protein